MATVTVTALKTFEFNGRRYGPGDPVECEPVDASIKARRGLVSLTKRTYLKVNLQSSEPVPAPEPPKRRRGRPRKTETAEAGVYARRDMRAEE